MSDEEKKIALSGILVFSLGLGTLLFRLLSLPISSLRILSSSPLSRTLPGEREKAWISTGYSQVWCMSLWSIACALGDGQRGFGRIASKGIELFKSRKS